MTDSAVQFASDTLGQLESPLPGLSTGTTPYSKSMLQQYKAKEVETASPETILLMLYDGAIKFLKQSKVHYEAGEIEPAYKNLASAQNIISEFMNTLDMETTGETGQNLYRLYDYYHYRLVEANLKRDTGMIEEVIGHLTQLRKTWAEAIVVARKERQAENAN